MNQVAVERITVQQIVRTDERNHLERSDKPPETEQVSCYGRHLAFLEPVCTRSAVGKTPASAETFRWLESESAWQLFVHASL